MSKRTNYIHEFVVFHRTTTRTRPRVLIKQRKKNKYKREMIIMVELRLGSIIIIIIILYYTFANVLISFIFNRNLRLLRMWAREQLIINRHAPQRRRRDVRSTRGITGQSRTKRVECHMSATLTRLPAELLPWNRLNLRPFSIG